MQIPCPHCHQHLEVEESWAGLEVECPLCRGKFAVPALQVTMSAATPSRQRRSPRRKTNHKLEEWKRRQRRRRIFSAVVVLVFLAGAVWWLDRYRNERSPAQVLREFATRTIAWVASRFSPPPPPPEPTPAPTPEPVATPESTPTPTPPPEPAPEAKDPVAWLIENPERRPPFLTLREAVDFPILYEGRAVGTVKVKPGTKVKLVDIRPPDAVEVRYRDGTTVAAYGVTDLIQLAAEEMAKPEPEPTPEVAEARRPTPAAPVAPKSKGDQLGATIKRGKDGNITGAVFRIWAPNAKSVSVIGSFNNWNAEAGKMTPDKKKGAWVFEEAGAKPGDEYMFLIDNATEIRDPRGREVSDAGKSLIGDPDAFDWGDDKSPAVELRNMVIYQLHPGTFYDPDPADGKSATLRDAIGKLDHLKELGVNCVLLMPVAEFSGDHSWGYNPSDPYAIERAYGGPDALREFVKEAHRRGIAVHVDVVHNHYGPDDLPLTKVDGNGEKSRGIYFYGDEERGVTPWGPRPDFGRPEVRSFIADQIRMLFDEYRIDGLRWDSVVNILRYDNGASENPDGERLIDELSRMIRAEYPGKVSVAEDAVGDDRFDSSWEYAFHHAGSDGKEGVVPQLVKPPGEADVGDIAAHLNSDLGFSRVIYTENHDETGRLNGKRRMIVDVDESDPHSLVARRKHALAAVLTLTSPGVPLIFMGQELLEDAEFHDSNPLNWERGDLSVRATKLYGDLVHLRRNLDGRGTALQDAHIRIMKEDRDRQILVYRRYVPGKPEDDLVIAVNLSPEPVENFPLTLPRSAKWKLLLNTDDPQYGADFTGVATPMPDSECNQLPARLAPFSAQIFGVERK